jgi:cholesterol transport system auxiliary component
MKTLLQCIVIAVAAAAVSGCALLARPNADLVVYAPALSLPAPSAPMLHSPEPHWQITVAEPQAPNPLLGTRILVAPQPRRIEVYHGARWQDAPAAQLKSLLVQALREAGAPHAADTGSAQRTDYLLESELVRFQAEYRGATAPTVTVCVYARLIRVGSGEVVASQEFAVDEPAASSAVPVVVEAFERAVNRVVRDGATWAVAAADRASEPPRKPGMSRSHE